MRVLHKKNYAFFLYRVQNNLMYISFVLHLIYMRVSYETLLHYLLSFDANSKQIVFCVSKG